MNFLRKMQASFAWDWGPAFPSVGIWYCKIHFHFLKFMSQNQGKLTASFVTLFRKSVEIEAFDLGIIRDITAKPYKVNSTLWKVNATFYVEFAEDEIPQHITHGYLSKINSNERVISDVVPNEQVISEAVFEDDKAKDPNVKNGYVYNAQFSIPQVRQIKIFKAVITDYQVTRIISLL